MQEQGAMAQQDPPVAPIDRTTSTHLRDQDDDDEDKMDRMRVARMFQSNDSVSEILKGELFKSVVSNELNSLNSIATAEDSPALPGPRRASRSSTASGFVESMLATMKSSNSSNSAVANGGGGATSSLAPPPPATPSTTSDFMKSMMTTLKRKPSSANNNKPPEDIANLTSSKNWNNLGSHEDININVAEVFKTQQESSATALAVNGGGSKKKAKGKTNWDELAKQGLQSSVAAPAEATLPPPVPTRTASAAMAAQTNDVNTKKRGRVKAEPQPAKKAGKDGSSSEKIYYEPTDADVLLGRGGRANNHPGNKRYLEIKDSIQERYMKAEKSQKTAISEELMEMVKQWGGRFLKLDDATNQWYEVDKTTARKKCSQTLREINTPEVRLIKRQKYNK